MPDMTEGEFFGCALLLVVMVILTLALGSVLG